MGTVRARGYAVSRRAGLSGLRASMGQRKVTFDAPGQHCQPFTIAQENAATDDAGAVVTQGSSSVQCSWARGLPRTSSGRPVRRSTECRSQGEQNPRYADRVLRTRLVWNWFRLGTHRQPVPATVPRARPKQDLLHHSARPCCSPISGIACLQLPASSRKRTVFAPSGPHASIRHAIRAIMRRRVRSTDLFEWAAHLAGGFGEPSPQRGVAAGDGLDGAGLRALIVILWRAGLLIGEATSSLSSQWVQRPLCAGGRNDRLLHAVLA
jgi:hypothetical protein